jgi:anti-sigma factor RsiW
MNEHITIADLLPMYVSGALERSERQKVERHLAECAECQADLE